VVILQGKTRDNFSRNNNNSSGISILKVFLRRTW